MPRTYRSQGRSRYANENHPQSRNARPRDEEGRFISDDDYEGGYGRSSSGRHYTSSSRGRSQGGWFGDPEGHSRAAREGWGEEEYGYQPPRSRRNQYTQDDYEGGSYSSGRSGRRNYAASARGRSHGGWFGDSEGHSAAAREGWGNPDHAPSGWFGDAEGHSAAAREGWENPDHGPSGWFGDEEGHREAAEMGWEHGHQNQRSGRSQNDYDYEPRARRRRAG